MNITFLTANDFEAIRGKTLFMEAGFGIGRNVTKFRKDNDGRVYAKLSPIADKSYGWCTATVRDDDYLARRIRNL